MSDFDSPFIIEREPFTEAYLQALEALADVGILLNLNERIPIFRVYSQLHKMEQTDDVEYAMWQLDVLKDLMVRGLEPEHKNNTYT